MYLPEDAKIAEAIRHLEMSEKALSEEISRSGADQAFRETLWRTVNAATA